MLGIKLRSNCTDPHLSTVKLIIKKFIIMCICSNFFLVLVQPRPQGLLRGSEFFSAVM